MREIYILMCLIVFLRHIISTKCMPGALRGQNKEVDTLELEIQKVVSHYVSAGIRTWVFYKRRKYS